MINKALRMAREFHHMKQVELAKHLSISTSYLSEIESGKKPPSIEILEAYGRVFSIPASTFLLFKEHADGRDDARRVTKAKKMLQFFEWVLEEADDNGKKKKAATA
jgi:transcriptional regulator with XRE-family HTH domain